MEGIVVVDVLGGGLSAYRPILIRVVMCGPGI